VLVGHPGIGQQVTAIQEGVVCYKADLDTGGVQQCRIALVGIGQFLFATAEEPGPHMGDSASLTQELGDLEAGCAVLDAKGYAELLTDPHGGNNVVVAVGVDAEGDLPLHYQGPCLKVRVIVGTRGDAIAIGLCVFGLGLSLFSPGLRRLLLGHVLLDLMEVVADDSGGAHTGHWGLLEELPVGALGILPQGALEACGVLDDHVIDNGSRRLAGEGQAPHRVA